MEENLKLSLRQIVIDLHDEARRLEKTSDPQKVSADIRKKADQLSKVVETMYRSELIDFK